MNDVNHSRHRTVSAGGRSTNGNTTMKKIQIILPAALAFILWANPSFAGSANNAWNNLVGTKNMERPEFAYEQNNTSLPNVLLYGDSISMGYTPRVREILKGKANVYRIYCNGGDTEKVIPTMQEMHDAMAEHWSFKWDVIHFNAGLHDLKYLNKNGNYDTENGTQVRSPETYAENLKLIFAYFRKIVPEAKIIFATTTPVPDKSSGRKAGDAVKFNEAALDVLKEYPRILINDLYAFTKPHYAKWQASPGNVHYNNTGMNAQGDEVARVILKALSKNNESNKSDATDGL
jgi:hypothetical protein